MPGRGEGDMRRFRFFPSSILSFFWGSPLGKGEFKTARSIFRACIGILVMSYLRLELCFCEEQRIRDFEKVRRDGDFVFSLKCCQFIINNAGEIFNEVKQAQHYCIKS